MKAVTLSDDLESRPALQAVTPAASTWGWHGHHHVWLGPANDWVYPHLHATAERLVERCRMTRDPSAGVLRALRQALREPLLAQASDWAFMTARDTAVEYATRRTVEHLLACQWLCDGIRRGVIDESLLAELETRNPVFPALDLDVLG